MLALTSFLNSCLEIGTSIVSHVVLCELYEMMRRQRDETIETFVLFLNTNLAFRAG